MMFKKLFYLLSIISLTSCATTYTTIHPDTINYGAADEQDGVKLEYKYEVLQKKYAKKEKKKGVKVVAVKITNTTASDLTMGQNLAIQNGAGNQINLLDDQQIFGPLKQSVPTYLLYMLLTPMTLNQTTTENQGGFVVTKTEPIFPLGLIVGPGITALNMITAGGANKKFKTELAENNLLGRTIKAGETVTGLIGFRSDSYDNLKVLLKQ